MVFFTAYPKSNRNQPFRVIFRIPNENGFEKVSDWNRIADRFDGNCKKVSKVSNTRSLF